MLVLFGSISVDLVFLVAALPQPNQTVEALGANLLAVVRSLGVSGLEYASDGAIGRLPPRPVHVADETGAQDCLSGVLAAALDRGLALEDAIRRANVAASICCERPGAQAAMPFAAEIDAAMAG